MAGKFRKTAKTGKSIVSQLGRAEFSREYWPLLLSIKIIAWISYVSDQVIC